MLGVRRYFVKTNHSRRYDECRVLSTPPGPLIQHAIVFFAALALRALAIVELGSIAISRTPQLDSAEYLNWAHRIAGAGFVWAPYPEHGPGYPFFLGGLLAVFGGTLTPVRVVQAILGAAGCVLTARVAARTLTPRAFLPAGLLQAAYAPLIYLDTALLAESLFVFLLVLSLELATDAKGRTGHWLASGLALGAASIVRPTGLVLAMVYLVMLFRSERRETAPRLAVVFAIGVAALVGPVVLQNWRTSGIVGVQAYGGLNTYLGNRPSGDGGARARLGGEWDALEGQASVAGTSRADQDPYYLARTLTEIRERPLGYARLLANKLAWMTQAEELRDTHSFYFFREVFPLLAWLPGFGVIAAFAVVGLIGVRGPAAGWLVWSLVALACTVVFLVVGLRYRVPMVPILIAFAGAGVATIIERIRAREWRSLAIPAAIFVAVLAVTHVRVDAASRNLSEEWAFTALSQLQEGAVELAEAAAQRATTLDPRSSFAWDILGMIALGPQSFDRAQEAFAKAVEINPSNATAWLHLGLAREFARDREGAIAAYRKAIAITPERTEVVGALGGALFAGGAVEEALPLLNKAAERDHPEANLALATHAMQRRDAAAARRFAERAAGLAPSARAWSLVAQSAIASGAFADAERALGEAERAGLDPRQLIRLRVILLKTAGRDFEAERLLDELALRDPALAEALRR